MTSSEAPAPIREDRVTEWFAQHIPQARAPLTFELIAGGRSNLTFRVIDSDGAVWVLRRPPLSHVLATAHDMSREHRVLSAFAATDVPVPKVFGPCADPEVNGSSFYVMGFVEGRIIDTTKDIEPMGMTERRRVGESMADVLAAIHGADIDALGLGDLGRREGYINRQLERWNRQFQSSKTRDVPIIEDVYHRLAARVPEQPSATVVHGDYSIHNMLMGTDGAITAVLDWEMSTLGDPMADVGYLAISWSDPGEAGLHTATQAEGVLRRKELLERYATTSGRDITAIDFYMAFAYWKLACILEGVHTRYLKGAMGDADPAQTKYWADNVATLASSASDALERYL